MNGLILSINNSIQMKFMFLTIQVASQKIITRGFPESKYSRLTSGFNSTRGGFMARPAWALARAWPKTFYFLFGKKNKNRKKKNWKKGKMGKPAK
jgi:hypothetical protein